MVPPTFDAVFGQTSSKKIAFTRTRVLWLQVPVGKTRLPLVWATMPVNRTRPGPGYRALRRLRALNPGA